FSGSQIIVASNSSSSDYHALQLQFQRRMIQRLAALVSYTWSHSLDDTSDDEGFDNLNNVNVDRGPSDFDVRQSLSVALTYQVPGAPRNRTIRAILSNWSTAAILFSRTALPVNVFVDRADVNSDPTLMVDSGKVRPDRVPGVPLYIDDSTVAESRRINPAAFSVSSEI